MLHKTIPFRQEEGLENIEIEKMLRLLENVTHVVILDSINF